jgi:peptide/nickel transport system permease protein
LFGLAIFADIIANYDLLAVKQNVANRLLFPGAEHWFGTDLYGRDIFARIIHGTRIALILGFGATTISVIIASILGSTSAYFGGRFDYLVTRIVDTLLAIPSLLLALALVASIGSGLIQLVIAISLGQIANFTRIIRSVALSVVNLEFIEAGKALGASDSWIILRYVIPNIIGIVLIQGAMQVSMNILMGATLSFVGLGIQVPTPEWGAMLAEGLSYMQYRPYLVIVPGIFLMITALSINTFGDCLRDAFDPRLKGKS